MIFCNLAVSKQKLRPSKRQEHGLPNLRKALDVACNANSYSQMKEKDMGVPSEFARVIEWTPAWSTGAPCPQVFSNGHETYLSYYTDLSENALVLVTFHRSFSHRFGIVNDEAADGHPLYEKGLQTYRAHIIENSGWIEEHKRIHKVHPYYSDKHWINHKHFLLFFHDEIFEIIFSGDYKIETFNSTMKEIAMETAMRLNS